MAWTAPSTWVAGAILTAAQLNEQLRDNMNFLAVPNMCRARSTTATGIPTSVATVVPLAAADSYDTAAMHSPTVNNSRVTVNLIGVYSITGELYIEGFNSGSQRIIIIYKNGAEIQSVTVPPPGAFISRLNITILDYASSATDYYEMYAYHDRAAGVGLNLSATGAGGETASLAVTYMGATA